MIVFKPIGITEYNMNVQLEFKTIPVKLIEHGDFEIYVSSRKAHQIAKNESERNADWGYVGFVIQYCIETEYLDSIIKLGKYGNKDGVEDVVIIPKQDATRIDKLIAERAFVVGFYYNHKNMTTEFPIEKKEIRRLQIIHYYTQWDPEGLLDGGGPRDEYYNEIHRIINRLTENTSTEKLAMIIKEETEKAFGENYIRNRTNILGLAKKIDQVL